MTRFLLEHTQATIRAFSRDENKQFHMRQRFGDERVRYLLGDVRERHRLETAFCGADLAFHAAALKHVPAGQYNPTEFKRTNIDGTENVLSACQAMGVKTAVFISSDKAVASVNLYGHSKAMAEQIWTQGNAYAPHGTSFITIRYGNVRNSRGSVLEIWRAQLAAGEAPTITSPDMSRFDLSIDEAVRLAWFATQHVPRGCIVVPHLPAYNVLDLLEAVCGDDAKPFRLTGLRPGEKRAELLATDEEMERAYAYMYTTPIRPHSYVIPPIAPSWPFPMPAAWHAWLPASLFVAAINPSHVPYRSDVWPDRLTVADLRRRLAVPT